MPSLHIKILKTIGLLLASIFITFASAYGCHVAEDHMNQWWGWVFGLWSVTFFMGAIFAFAFGCIKIYE